MVKKQDIFRHFNSEKTSWFFQCISPPTFFFDLEWHAPFHPFCVVYVKIKCGFWGSFIAFDESNNAFSGSNVTQAKRLPCKGCVWDCARNQNRMKDHPAECKPQEAWEQDADNHVIKSQKQSYHQSGRSNELCTHTLIEKHWGRVKGCGKWLGLFNAFPPFCHEWREQSSSGTNLADTDVWGPSQELCHLDKAHLARKDCRARGWVWAQVTMAIASPQYVVICVDGREGHQKIPSFCFTSISQGCYRICFIFDPSPSFRRSSPLVPFRVSLSFWNWGTSQDRYFWGGPTFLIGILVFFPLIGVGSLSC